MTLGAVGDAFEVGMHRSQLARGNLGINPACHGQHQKHNKENYSIHILIILHRCKAPYPASRPGIGVLAINLT